MKHGNLAIVAVLGAVLTGTLSAPAAVFDQSHALWSQVLQAHTIASGQTTQVNYSMLKKDPASLDAYLGQISAVSEAEYGQFSKEQQLAFLFNAYNAFTVRLILNQAKIPVSIKDIKERSFSNPLGSPWKYRFFRILGKESHLDHIEHELARPKFDEPRLHFAFNCASVGCPSLLREAFTAEKLEAQLTTVAKSFLNDTTRNRWDATANKIELSQIFEWYGEDFNKSKKLGNLRRFLGEYMSVSPEARKIILEEKTKIEFLPYDWNLNSVAP